MPQQESATPPPVADTAATKSVSPTPGGLPHYPRQTPPGYYGPRTYGPNGWAIASFVIGLAGGTLLGILFAVRALSQIRDTGQSGRSLAIAGLILSTLWIVYIITLIATGHTVPGL